MAESYASVVAGVQSRVVQNWCRSFKANGTVVVVCW